MPGGMQQPGTAHVLSVVFDTTQPNYPKVRLLIDGDESLARDGDEPSSPVDLLQSGALLPVDPPRRVAFYGCGCGEFGCANVAGLITRRGDRIVWSDFRSLTGAYTRALPPPEESPDPYAARTDRSMYRHSELDLPTCSFDARQYLAAVSDATADRGWENRPQAVVREIRALRPELRGIWPTTLGERIEVNYPRPDQPRDDWAELDIPQGAPHLLARSLVRLLESGAELKQIERERLWR